jgi:hypothetical protein
MRDMSTTPTRPRIEAPVDEETRRIIEQRLATFDEDCRTAVDAKEALAAIRKNLKDPSPR